MRRPAQSAPEEPRPGRGRSVLRIAVGALLGAAACLGIGELIAATGGA